MRVALFAGCLVAAALPASAAAAKSKAPPVLKGASAGIEKPEVRSFTLVYGDDHVFGITPPAGWVVDDTSGLGSRIRVVLYPRGEKWASAATVMYANPLHQDDRVHYTFQQLLDKDVADFRKVSPKGTVVTAPTITTTKGQAAEVRYFSHEGGEPREAVAYLAEERLVMLLVLSARDPADFKRTLPAFHELVQSYQFVGSGMKTPTSK